MTAAFDQVAMGLDAGAPVLLGSVNEPDAIRILLIGDSAIDRGFLANELSTQGFAVQTVTSLAAAPDAVGDADVIVLHCDWTKVSSIELLDKLQRQTAGVPIVLLAGEASPAREDVALDKARRSTWSASHGARRFWPGASNAPSRLSGVRANCGPAGAWPRPARWWRRPKR